MLPLAVSLGDLGGVGIEVTLKALADQPPARPVVLFGDGNAVASVKRQLSLGLAIEAGPPPPEAAGGVFLRASTALDEQDFKPGAPSRAAARSTLLHLTEAVDAVRDGTCAALVTAPIQKEKLSEVGFTHPGHTEFLAERTGASRFAMMLAGDRLRVTLVTIHCALKDVASKVTRPGVVEKIELTHAALTAWFGIERPKIAVLGLNPHAGEGGLFGDEETRAIRPAIEEMKARGMDVDGPHPADGFFGKESRHSYDAVVCMYHDQGLIPLKMEHFWDGVNLTLGLPIIRTSPDHGTAYDIAGKGIADARSMAQAIRWADRFARTQGG